MKRLPPSTPIRKPPSGGGTAPKSAEDALLDFLKSQPGGTKFRFKLPDLDNYPVPKGIRR
jgi:hypothetical protein